MNKTLTDCAVDATKADERSNAAAAIRQLKPEVKHLARSNRRGVVRVIKFGQAPHVLLRCCLS
jgi:hypothetical protein